MKEFIKSLAKVQSELKAPKGQRNSFGNYNYRSCEDILEALKPLLKQHELFLSISDEIIEVGGRIYVQATALITDGEHTQMTQACAREAETKKGMDAAQITGAASSYARKYALNGLFGIDDTKDADSTNKHDDKPKRQENTPSTHPGQKNVYAISETSFFKTLVPRGKTEADRKFLKESIQTSQPTWFNSLEEWKAAMKSEGAKLNKGFHDTTFDIDGAGLAESYGATSYQDSVDQYKNN